MSLKLLVVEDEENQVRSYSKSVKRWNEAGNEAIEMSVAKDKEKAESSLGSNDYDAAILDLRFPGDTPHHATGNDILGIIKEQLRYPVYVVSGNPKELDSQFDDHPFIEAIERSSITNDELLHKIFTRYSTGVTKIMGKAGKLEEALNKVFWNHLPHAISHWEGVDDLSPDVKEKQLLRYILSHLQEILAIDEAGIDEKCNTAEVYIKPPVKESITPGLIVEMEGEKYLVITPVCDISQEKAEFFQFVRLLKFEQLPDIQSKGRSGGRKDKLKSYIENKSGRFHFLPRYDDLPDSVIDFQNITTIESDLPQNYKGVCQIAPPFFKDIVNRFSSYYARQGSPDFTDTDALSEQLNERLHKEPIV